MDGALSRIGRFGIVGLSGILIDFSVTWLCKEKFKINKFVSNTCGFTLAVINNYTLNRIWTFKNTNPAVLKQFSLFLVVSLAGLFLSTLVIYLLHEKKKLPFYISKIISIGIVFCWNFAANSGKNFIALFVQN